MQCLSGNDSLGYDFLSVTKNGFVSVSVQPVSKDWLGDMGFQ
jgi:hypothetical protein